MIMLHPIERPDLNVHIIRDVISNIEYPKPKHVTFKLHINSRSPLDGHQTYSPRELCNVL